MPTPPVSAKLSWMIAPPLGRTLALLDREPRCLRPENWVKTLGMVLRGGMASALGRLAPPAAPDPLPPPVFIVGFWRSGTTLLHELLCLDAGVAAPSSYDCMAPGHAHWSRDRALAFGRGRFASRRPMDDMVIEVDSPQEDEFYLLNAGVRSFYELFLYPEEGLAHLAALDPAGWPPEERAAWLAAMDRLLGLQARPGVRRAVLKSPTHAFRIPLLQARYPEAAFVCLHRDPVEVLLSTRNTWRANARLFALHRPGAEADLDALVAACHRLHGERVAEARTLPGIRWFDLDYARLVRDPIAAVEDLYAHFDWPGFPEVAPRLGAYRDGHAGYRPNAFRLATPADRRLLQEALG